MTKKIVLIFEHLPLTILVCFLGSYFQIDVISIIAILFFGWLIDVDHLFDYLIFCIRDKTKPNLYAFLDSKYFKLNKKIYLPLHSWEICSVFLILFLISFQVNFLLIFLSYSLHLIQDQLTNNVKYHTYFLFIRAKYNFNLYQFCK